MAKERVESIGVALVREYLSRKGFKQSLKMLDKEFPRTVESINNRLILAKELHIERLMRKNKELVEPFRTMIEVLVLYLTERGSSKTNINSNSPSGNATSNSILTCSSPSVLKRSSSLQDIGQSKSSQRRSSNLYGSEINLSKSEEEKHPDGLSSTGNVFSTDRKTPDCSDLPKAITSEKGSCTRSNVYNETFALSISPNSVTNSRKSSSIQQQLGKNVKKSKQLRPTGLMSTLDRRPYPRSEKKPLDLSFMDSVTNDSLNHKPTVPVQSSLKQMKIEKIESQSKASTLLDNNTERRNGRTDYRKQIGDVMFDDIEDDFNEDINNIALGPRESIKTTMACTERKNITLEVAMDLKNLIFGSANTAFQPEWINQTLSFCELPDLRYGIVQLKGGPCGVLAAIQAVLLKYLIFEKESSRRLQRLPSPSEEKIVDCLSTAIVDILWKAGANKSAILALSSQKKHFLGGGRYKPDGITETLILYTFTNHSNLVAFVKHNIFQFQKENSAGCILLLYSAIFSRGIKRIQKDMDEANGTLIGSHGYCTQELVNLLLTGMAVSNVFDDVVELDSGGLEKSVLKGIDKQSDIGFLSLFEHYQSCQVGKNYKNPKFPIWVVCSESHFSVLFSVSEEAISSRTKHPFDLYYYDGLARQDEEIRLTLDCTKPWEFDSCDDDLIPPLELCIRTKWNCSISWNGTEPIL